jgi:hypothetical protein
METRYGIHLDQAKPLENQTFTDTNAVPVNILR